MNETSGSSRHAVSSASALSQSVYGWALITCIAVASSFVVLVLTGKFDTAFEKIRSGLANVGVEQSSDASSSVTPEAEENTSEIEAIQDGSTPTFDIVRVEPTGEAVMAGVALPNNQIQIVSDGEIIAEAKANGSGEWALVLETAFAPGGHSISIRTISAKGEAQALSEEQVTIGVPNAPTESAIVMLDSPGEPSAIWQSPSKIIRPTVTSPEEEALELEGLGDPKAEPNQKTPEQSIEQATAPSSEKPDEDAGTNTDIPDAIVTVEAIETETDGTLFAAGASNPDTMVRVYFDEVLIGQTTTDSIGRWRLSTQHLLTNDSYAVRVDQVDSQTGEVRARRAVPFYDAMALELVHPIETQTGAEIEKSLNLQSAEGEGSTSIQGQTFKSEIVIVNKGDSLWSISRRLLGRGIRYTTLYDANESQISDPSVVFPGQVFVVPDEELPATQN